MSPIRRDPWIEEQPFKIRVKAILGSKSIYSEEGQLSVLDPCKDTEIFCYDLDDMEIVVNEEAGFQEFIHFEDSVAI